MGIISAKEKAHIGFFYQEAAPFANYLEIEARTEIVSIVDPSLKVYSNKRIIG